MGNPIFVKNDLFKVYTFSNDRLNFVSQMVNTLTNLQIGEKAIISGLKPGDCQNALLALGFLTGKSIEVTLKAPFNGPIAVRLGQTLISLRLEEALQVLIDTPNR